MRLDKSKACPRQLGDPTVIPWVAFPAGKACLGAHRISTRLPSSHPVGAQLGQALARVKPLHRWVGQRPFSLQLCGAMRALFASR